MLRLLLVTLAAGFAKGLPWTTNIAWLVAVGWLVTAVVLGLRLPDPTTPATPSPTATEAADDTPEDTAPAPGGITRERLVQALHTVGAPHAHTSALADHLNAPTEAVREALAAADIPTSGGVRMKGRRVAVSPGVKAGDFPPLPSPTDEGALGGVLTSNNNDNNNAGRDFELIPDTENPARTHVRWLRR